MKTATVCGHCEGPVEWVPKARRWVCASCHRLWLATVEKAARGLSALPGSKAFR